MDRRTFVKLAAAAGLSVAVPTTRAIASEDEGKVVFTEDLAAVAANSFLNSFYPNENLSISSVTQYATIDDVVDGYIVGFANKDGLPYGYLTVSANAPGLYADFVIEEGALPPHLATIKQCANQQTSLISNTEPELPDDAMVYLVNAVQYGVYSPASEQMLVLGGKTVDIPKPVIASSIENSGTKPATWKDASISVSDVYKNYTVTNGGNLSSWVSTTQNRIIAITGRYACSVTALFVCAGFHGIADPWDDADAYCELWDLTGTVTDTTNTTPGAWWGLTARANVIPGYKEFAARRGLSVTGRDVVNPSFNEYVSSINNNKICLMHAGLNDENGVRSGHSMAVEGFLQALSNSDYSGLRILQVFDGWYSGVRYINFDFDRYTDFAGTFFAV